MTPAGVFGPLWTFALVRTIKKCGGQNKLNSGKQQRWDKSDICHTFSNSHTAQVNIKIAFNRTFEGSNYNTT